MKKFKMIAILLASPLFLAVCSTEPEIVNEDTVNHIEFKNGDEIVIDTERIVIATEKYYLNFVETSGGDYVIRENDYSNGWLFDNPWTYTVLVPTGEVKELSRQYAEAFNDTLPIEPPESEK